MNLNLQQAAAAEIDSIQAQGLYKHERVLDSPQDAVIRLRDGRDVINLCANNYLGLCRHPAVVQAAAEAMQRWGYGLSSVRFICGTQQLHKQLEERLSAFLGTEDTLLYAACFDANGGLFEPLLDARDAIFSDRLNHASLIDGIRLCKARRLPYANGDMADLESKLREAGDARLRLIATDGVFSMDGTIAPLDRICDLAELYDAAVVFDDCHAVGFLGRTGRGTHEYRNCMQRVDLITGTLGKALGGASGGYISGPRAIIELLRQRSRPYLFSNTLAPAVAGGALKALELIDASSEWRDRLADNTRYFRNALRQAGFEVPEGDHPIVPIMLGDAMLAQRMAEAMLDAGVYVVGFFYPVVPRGTARIRTQVSAAHQREHLDRAVEAFCTARRTVPPAS